MSGNILQRLAPLSYGIAVVVTAITGLTIIGSALWSLVSHHEALGISVGVMLLLYGAIIVAITVAAWQRRAWAWGMLVAVCLLNAFTAGSFVFTEDLGQFWLAIVWVAAAVLGGVAAVLPATRTAMQRG